MRNPRRFRQKVSRIPVIPVGESAHETSSVSAISVTFGPFLGYIYVTFRPFSRHLPCSVATFEHSFSAEIDNF